MLEKFKLKLKFSKDWNFREKISDERVNSPQSARQKSPTALKRLDISIKRTLKIGHRLRWFCAMQQRKKPVTSFLSQPVGCGDRTWTCDLRVMRNSKFVRYGAILLGLVVLRTKAQNGFCPMCTKECCIVLTHSNPFWGQFWGQICETDSDSQRSNKCAALVPLRKVDTHITGFTQVKSPTNWWWNFTL